MTDPSPDTAPNSSGTAGPAIPVPAGACDAHMHVLDPRFPTPEASRPAGMTLGDYRRLQRRLGLTRAVLVQAKYHSTDHACLLDGLERLDGKGRGVAVVAPDVPDAELKRLDAAGVRGLRFSVWNPADTVATIDSIEPLAAKIAALGWHAQIHMSGQQIAEHVDLLGRLPCPIVFDHMARLDPALGPDDPAFGVVARLVERDRAWVKLSGAYLNTRNGPPGYPDASRVARAFVALAPERLVWGSDWPHVTETLRKPDDAVLLDLLASWSGDPAIRDRILVDNPERLYGFAPRSVRQA